MGSANFCKISIIIDYVEEPSLVLHGHRAYLDPSVLTEAKKLNIQLLCLPAHCSHEFQPLDKSYFPALEMLLD
jgi:hypothetical protein